jgi:hypothetical protein
MNMKRIARVALPILAAASLFAFAAPPIYPGAKPVDELNDAMKKVGQDNMAYNTFDPFEKVYAFYKGKGTEVQGRRAPRASEKFASFKFDEAGYGVAISWKEDSKSKGTIIHIAKIPGR